MAFIDFIGVVAAQGRGKEGQPDFAVCCPSRINQKTWRIISLEGKLKDGSPDYRLMPGQLVSGIAKLLGIFDGSLSVEFLGSKFNIIPENISQHEGKRISYVHNPHAMREMVLAAKRFYRFRLWDEYYTDQLKWYTDKYPFGNLTLDRLGHDRSSLATLNGRAMFFTYLTDRKGWDYFLPAAYAKKQLLYRNRITNKGIKAGIFLLCNTILQKHIPIFILAKPARGILLKSGTIYDFCKLPILWNNDTAPVSPMREAESTLFCGTADFRTCKDLSLEERNWIKNELADVGYMPTWLWQKYFTQRLEKKDIISWQHNGNAIMRESGESKKIHGWWYHWSWKTTLHTQAGEEIIILASDFRDGGATRILAIPAKQYLECKDRFPEFATAVSISKEPEMLEGNYKPASESWHEIKAYIRKNLDDLLDQE